MRVAYPEVLTRGEEGVQVHLPSTVFVIRETPYQLHHFIALLVVLLLLFCFCCCFVSPSYIKWDPMPLIIISLTSPLEKYALS